MARLVIINLDSEAFNFLDQKSKLKRKTKGIIIVEALSLLKKNSLKEQIDIGLHNRYLEYKEINSDFQGTRLKFLDE